MQMPGSAHASFTPCRVQEASFQGSQLHFTSFNTKHFGGASTYFKSSQVLKSGPVWVSFGCCLNKALQLHRQTSLSFRLLKEHQRKTHLDVSALRAHWKANTETPRSVHVWKMKRRSLEMFQISECEPAFETTSVLALSSPTRAPFSSCRLVPPAQNDSLHSLDSLRQGHALAPLTQDTTCPEKTPLDSGGYVQSEPEQWLEDKPSDEHIDEQLLKDKQEKICDKT